MLWRGLLEGQKEQRLTRQGRCQGREDTLLARWPAVSGLEIFFFDRPRFLNRLFAGRRALDGLRGGLRRPLFSCRGSLICAATPQKEQTQEEKQAHRRIPSSQHNSHLLKTGFESMVNIVENYSPVNRNWEGGRHLAVGMGRGQNLELEHRGPKTPTLCFSFPRCSLVYAFLRLLPSAPAPCPFLFTAY